MKLIHILQAKSLLGSMSPVKPMDGYTYSEGKFSSAYTPSPAYSSGSYCNLKQIQDAGRKWFWKNLDLKKIAPPVDKIKYYGN